MREPPLPLPAGQDVTSRAAIDLAAHAVAPQARPLAQAVKAYLHPPTAGCGSRYMRRAPQRQVLPAAAPLALLALVLAASAPCRAAGQTADPNAPAHLVSTPEEFEAALNNGTYGIVQIMKPLVLGRGFKATIRRPLLITSPARTQIVWCDAACMAGPPPASAAEAYPLIEVATGGSAAFVRLFFRAFVPPAGTWGGGDGAAAVAAMSKLVGPAMAAESPVPLGIGSAGGTVSAALLVAGLVLACA